MKKLILLLAVIATASFAQVAPPAVPAPAPAAPHVDTTSSSSVAIAELTKARDEAKAQVASLQAQQQQQAVITEYYKIVAERNEALLRLNQAQTENAALKSALDQAKAALLSAQAAAVPAPNKK